jgi:hypothetical protein
VFRDQVAGALAQIREALRGAALQCAVSLTEEQHCFAEGQTVLGAAERQRIDTGVDAEGPRVAAERRDGVGKARAIDVYAVAEPMGALAQFGELGRIVHGSELGGVGERQHAGLCLVHVAGLEARQAHQIARRDSIGARVADDPRSAARDALGCGGLVLGVVTVAVAEHLLPRIGQRGDRQYVRRRTRCDEEHLGVAAKQCAEGFLGLIGVGVLAVADVMRGVVGRLERLLGFGAQACVVVAAKAARGLHVDGEISGVGVDLFTCLLLRWSDGPQAERSKQVNKSTPTPLSGGGSSSGHYHLSGADQLGDGEVVEEPEQGVELLAGAVDAQDRAVASVVDDARAEVLRNLHQLGSVLLAGRLDLDQGDLGLVDRVSGVIDRVHYVHELGELFDDLAERGRIPGAGDRHPRVAGVLARADHEALDVVATP